MSKPFKKYEIKGYELSDNVEVMFTNWKLTSDIVETLEAVEKAAIAAKSSGYDRIMRAIKKYPRIPVFKDVLIMYYNNRGDLGKAVEVNDKLLRDHPDFLPGYVNKALQYYIKDDFENMREVLTANFDLKDLFPARKVFHIREFLRMQYVAVLYFSAIDESEKAWDRYRIMAENGSGEDLTIAASEHLLNEDFDEDNLDNYDEEFDDDMEDEMMEGYVGPDVPEQPTTTKTKMPRLNHELSEELYFHFYDEFADGIITKIANLPRETLITDLETMINDSFERYTYLTEDDWEVDKAFVTHAIFMLAEINAVEKASLIYKVLSQSYDYLDYFLDVIFENDLFDPFYKLLAHDPEAMMAFIKKPGVANMSRIVVLSLIKELAIQDPKQKLVAINYHNQLLDFLIAAKPEDNVFDNMLVDGVVANLLLLQAKQSLPKIKYVLDEGMLLNFADMPFEVMKGILQNPRQAEKLPLLSMVETYDKLEFPEPDEFDDEDYDFDPFGGDMQLPDGMTEEKFNELLLKAEEAVVERRNKDDHANRTGMTVVKSPKPGRNDACHCGSGKKYKKCCLGKDE
ncbi:YecA family protein [Cryomorpha ignava]|nr:SEC-C metal-binding domain-containing protein [Cryomorpha ignava]